MRPNRLQADKRSGARPHRPSAGGCWEARRKMHTLNTGEEGGWEAPGIAPATAIIFCNLATWVIFKLLQNNNTHTGCYAKIYVMSMRNPPPNQSTILTLLYEDVAQDTCLLERATISSASFCTVCGLGLARPKRMVDVPRSQPRLALPRTRHPRRSPVADVLTQTSTDRYLQPRTTKQQMVTCHWFIQARMHMRGRRWGRWLELLLDAQSRP
ncbi:hypothetical protein BDW22DRAFT_670788 [Trametopsis cervina]|nr:hypothetical protein BDW22DRAFT_670788 [Trametopsis cervina]